MVLRNIVHTFVHYISGVFCDGTWCLVALVIVTDFWWSNPDFRGIFQSSIVAFYLYYYKFGSSFAFFIPVNVLKIFYQLLPSLLFNTQWCSATLQWNDNISCIPSFCLSFGRFYHLFTNNLKTITTYINVIVIRHHMYVLQRGQSVTHARRSYMVGFFRE